MVPKIIKRSGGAPCEISLELSPCEKMKIFDLVEYYKGSTIGFPTVEIQRQFQGCTVSVLLTKEEVCSIYDGMKSEMYRLSLLNLVKRLALDLPEEDQLEVVYQAEAAYPNMEIDKITLMSMIDDVRAIRSWMK